MRLWSLHPKYLDPKGLVALWREALLAQKVLAGLTRGYRHHPQLIRFQQSREPGAYVAAYLMAVQAEATRRGYGFDAGKIGPTRILEPLAVTAGQIAYEWGHLLAKLEVRSPAWLAGVGEIGYPEPHPLFRVVDGGIAEWEVVTAR
ncbi:MAG: pyrimidine dimer DNA glycosylase/endonuclease V [Rhodocyclaceae bacterium]|nr:pyrimidine dimer DNA glycosylase/endonuclease V [Rhodocyclaceae bacterium]